LYELLQDISIVESQLIRIIVLSTAAAGRSRHSKRLRYSSRKTI